MPLIKPTEFTEDLALVPEMSEQDKAEVHRRIKVLEKALSDKGKAKYKIELMFVEKRSVWKPTKGVMSFWESGAKFHGGGDAKIYICPGRTLGRSECEAFIPDASNGYGHLVCPRCGVAWSGEQVIGELIANNTAQNWARLILKYYGKLEHNSDIYLKHAPDDIRSVAMVEQQKQLHGEHLAKMRKKRAIHVYPLMHIIKDTSAGADLLSRFYAFLTA